MYQSLIWPRVLRDDARGMRPAFDAEDMQRLANALVDRVIGNAELGPDFLRVQVLVDEQEAIELAGGEPRHTFLHRIRRARCRWAPTRVRQAVRVFQASPHLAQHCATPEHTSPSVLRSSGIVSPEFPQNFAEMADVALTVRVALARQPRL
jgi:hypothetical protein